MTPASAAIYRELIDCNRHILGERKKGSDSVAKVAVIGHFAFGHTCLNGQTIKTKIVTEELQKQLGDDEVLMIDTYGGWKTLLKAPFQTFRALKNSKNILIFPAHNGLRVYAPLLVVLRKLFKDRKLHYVVIGGWLPQFLSQKKLLTKVLKSFDGIYVETNAMKKALLEQGFVNVFVMPNCKQLNIVKEEDLVYPTGTPYKLCTFSRVSREKGIEDAVNAVKAVNNALGYQACALDIYGQIDAAQTEWFETLQNCFPEHIQYRGLVPFDKSVEVLKEYFALLFPTRYAGEGFAGTLIDAYSAGIPVIASDWKYNFELVNERTGYIYPTGNQRALVDVLKRAIENPETLLNKKRSCLQEAVKYRTDIAIRVLVEQLL